MNTVKEYEPIINTGIQLAFETWVKKNNFDTFITITFRAKYQPGTINKKIRDFLAHINDNDVIFYENSLSAWIFIEKNSFSSFSHAHLLTKGINPDKYQLLEKELFKLGHSEVKACHDNSVPYLASKYGKNSLLDNQFIRIHSRRDRAIKKRNRIANLINTAPSTEALAVSSV